MTANNNLGLGLVAEGQASKETTINDALLRLGQALSEVKVLDFTAEDQVLTLDVFQKYSVQICSNVTTARNLTLPTSVRWSYLMTPAGNTADVTVKYGTTTYVLHPGNLVLALTDGTADGLTVMAVGGAIGLQDAPNDTKEYLRSGGAWVEYAASEAGIGDVPAGTSLYLRSNGSWVLYTAPAAGIPEAPEDGHQYVRVDGGWAQVSVPTGAVTEAPEDGTPYVRQDGDWVAAPTPSGGSGGIPEAPADGTAYVRKNATWVPETVSTGGGGTGPTLAYDHELIIQHYDEANSGGLPVGFPNPLTPGNWVVAIMYAAQTTVPTINAGWTAHKTVADSASRHSGGTYYRQVQYGDLQTMTPFGTGTLYVAAMYEISGRFGLDASFISDTIVGAADRNASGNIAPVAFTPDVPELFLESVFQRPASVGALTVGGNLGGVYPYRDDGSANRVMQSGAKNIDPAAAFTPAPAWTASGDVQLGYGHFRLKLPPANMPAAPKVVQQAAFDGSTSASISATLPAAPTAGNLLVALVAHAQGAPTPGTGWTLLGHRNPLASDGVSIFTRVVQSGDTAALTCGTLGGSTSVNGVLYEVNGAQGVDHITMAVNSDQGTGTGAATTVPADTHTEAMPPQSLLLTMTALDASGIVAWSGLSGVFPTVQLATSKNMIAGRKQNGAGSISVPYSCKFASSNRYNYAGIVLRA